MPAPIDTPNAALLAEQSDYYRRRAPEYEDWWYRRGRYAHGAEADARWSAEAAELEAALERFCARGRVLELACGTGIWTRRLADSAEELTAIDASAEMLALNRAALPDPRVERRRADLFEWKPEETYDVCFFGFWLSHVPDAHFETFWENVAGALAPGGRVFFVDSAAADLSTASGQDRPTGEETMIRRLADGSEYRIVKRFHEPPALEERLARLGWSVRVEATPNFFIHGQGRPRAV